MNWADERKQTAFSYIYALSLCLFAVTFGAQFSFIATNKIQFSFSTTAKIHVPECHYSAVVGLKLPLRLSAHG